MLFHAFPSVMPGGFAGVDIFFVISGFLISGIIFKSLSRNNFSYAEFYGRRIRRIFPALAIVLAVLLIAGWLLALPRDYQQLGKHAAASAAFVANFAFWRESGYFDTPDKNPLLHLWSLGIEEQYYIVWPLLLAFLWKRTRSLLPIIAGFAVVSFGLNVWAVHFDPVTTFYFPFTRFWELLIGSLLAYISLFRGGVVGLIHASRKSELSQAQRERISNALSTVGAACVFATFAFLNEGRAFPGWWAVLPTTGAALLIAAGGFAWINRTILSHRLMVLVGAISYPLYLWHWPLLSFHNLVGLEWSTNQMRLLKAVMMTVAFVAAYVTYRWIETPIRRANSFKYVPQLSMAMAAILVAGLIIAGMRGFGNRFDYARQQVAQVGDPDETVNMVRSGTCFLTPAQGFKDFAPECLGRPGSGASPDAVLLWGDSHAAHLYYGLKAGLPNANTRLWQLTASSCPPLLGYESTQRPGCAEINRYVLEKIRQVHPGTVLLEAYWWRVPFLNFSRTDLLREVGKSIRALKESGVARIIIVGPVPVFRAPQPKLIVRHMVGDQIPLRLRPTDLESERSLDEELKEAAIDAGAHYVSPLSLECTAADCLVALRNDANGILAYDFAHLTPQGSEFVAQKLLLSEIAGAPAGNEVRTDLVRSGLLRSVGEETSPRR